MKKYWLTEDGVQIEYKKLEDNHLINILKWIKRRAKSGMEITMSLGWATDNDYIDYTSYEIIGKEVLEHYDHKGLLKEAKRRGLLIENKLQTISDK